MSGRVKVLIVLAAAVATLGACSSGKDFGAAVTSTTARGASPGPSTSTTSTSRAPNGVPASSDALAALLVDRVPAGFTLQPDDVGDTGPSDLAKAVRDDGSPDAETVLRAEGFVRGYQRMWADAEQAQIIVFVYQFATAAGARADYARTVASNRADQPASAQTYTVPGLPAAAHEGVEAVSTGTPSDGAASAVELTTGVFNVEVVCNGPRLAGLRARVVALAVEQYRRLPAG